MSVGRPGVQLTLVSDAEYRLNQERIEQAQTALDNFKAMNDAAKEAYDKQQELLRKIEEGRQAERQLLALTTASDVGQPAIAGPSGQSSSASTTYNPAWQSSNSQFPSNVDANVSGYVDPQWQAYGASLGNNQNYTAQAPGNHYSSQFRVNTHPQQPTQQYHRTPQVTQTARPRSAFVPQGGQLQPNVATRISQANGRLPTAFRGRQALRMRPVMQHAMQSNQSPASAPPRVSSGITTQGPDQSQNRAYPAPPASESAVPNFVDQVPAHPYRPPAAPESSSLAGALDATRSATRSTTVPSRLTVSSSDVPEPMRSSLSVTAARLQQQIAKSDTSSRTAPTEDTGPSRPGNGTGVNPAVPASTSGKSAGPGGMTSRNIPTLMDTNAIIKHVTSNAVWMGRLQAVVNRWEPTAPPHSYFSLPESNIKIYKGADSRVHLVFPLSQQDATKAAYIPFSHLLGLKASAPAQNVYQDDKGNFQYLTEPLTPEQAKKYRPYSIPPHTTIHHPSRSVALGTSTKTTPSTVPTTAPAVTSITHAAATIPIPGLPLSAAPVSSGPLIRTPAQADKRRLAKDLLRALNESPREISQPEGGPVSRPLAPSTTEQGITSLRSSSPSRPEADAVVPRSSAPKHTEIQRVSSAIVEHPDMLPPTDQRGNHYRSWTFHSTSEGVPSQPPSIPTTVPVLQPSVALSSTAAAPHEDIITSPGKVPDSPLTSPSNVPQTGNVASTSNLIFGLPPRQETPLFLPSPSSSPISKPTGDISNDLIFDDIPGTSRRQAESQPFYILVPPLPDYVQRYKSQQPDRKRPRLFTPDEYDSGIELRSTGASTVYDEDIVDTDPASHGFVNDDAERDAVTLSCSRLSKQSCKWNGCGTVLSSVEKLILHLALEHRQQSTVKGSYVCLWQQCGRHESNPGRLFHHLKNHATLPLLCAYQKCQGSFRTARQLAKHHQAEHSDAPLRSPASIFAPILEPPSDMPGVVPAYLLEPVRPAFISKERHATLGPWVLRNIAGPVNLGIRRYNAASKLSQSLSGEGENRIANQPYDFLSFPSTNFSSSPSQPSRIRGMRNLDSGEVSEMAQDGMVLWHIPDEPKQEETDEIGQLFSSPSPETTTQEGERDETFATEPAGQSSDEEAVQNMLSIL